MYKLLYSPKALDDLQNIRNGISQRHGEDNSKYILKKMLNKIRRLEQFPNSGEELSRMIDAQTDYFYLFTEKNYVFYRIDGNSIRIVRILNERMDFMQILFGISNEADEDEEY